MFGNVFAVTVIFFWLVVVGGTGCVIYFSGRSAYRRLQRNSRLDIEQEHRGSPHPR